MTLFSSFVNSEYKNNFTVDRISQNEENCKLLVVLNPLGPNVH